jgi:hypothetical protein
MSLAFANAINSLRPIQKFPTGVGLFSTGPVDVTFDSAMVAGGYLVTPTALGGGFNEILEARFIGWKGGPISGVGRAEWDATNKKLIPVADGSEEFIKIETVTMTSNAGRMSRPPGYIIAARAIGTTSGSLRIIPSGKTPATKQVAVNLVTGAVSTFATDAVTSIVFIYIPLGVGPFIEANRVVDEAHTFTTGGANLANRAALIQYVWNDTDTTHLPAIQPVGEAPATHQIAIDINNSGATTITPNSAQNTNTGLVTYWKFSALGLDKFAWTDQADITITSTTLFAFADDLAVPPNGIWVPGFGNVIVGETASGTTNLQGILVDPSGTPATNVLTYYPFRGQIVPVVGDAYVTIEMPYVLLNEANCPALGGQLPAGFNLTGLVGRFEFIGR